MTSLAESSAPTSSSTWVDRLRMVPIVPVSLLEKSSTEDGAYYSHATAAATASATEHQHQRRDATIDQPPQSLEFNIVSLNMLAETYISPRSHPGLPASYANVVFDSTKRRKLLVDTLERFCSPQKHTRGSKDKWDVIALQELDLVEPDDPILPAFQRWGYEVVRTPNDKRKDCCAIVFDSSKFSLIEYDVVKFDDLASLQHSVSSKEDEDDVTKKSSNSPPELTGLVRSFLRRNYAIVAHLKSVDTKQSVIVASVHLYWNPGFEYVKLCQAKYLLDRVAKFATVKARSGEGIEQIPPTTDHKALLLPTVICGDMNSKPGSVVHSLFVKPYVDARTVAPWNYFWGQDEEIMYTEEEKNGTRDDEKDRQDGVVAAKSDPTNERDDDQKNGVNGFTMNGLPSHLTMYCGLTADDNDSSRNGGTQEPTQQNDHLEAHVQIDAEYEGLRSSLLAWNGLHKRAMETSSPMNVSLPTDDATNSDDDGLKASLAWSKLHQRITPQDYQHSIPPLNIKYMLDYTLNRFTRWLRILGIDAALETLEEEKERTSGGEIALFDHCKREQRTLLTTSYKLLLRKDCPPGAYLLDPKSTSDLEKSLPRLLRTHGVELSPRTFLTRCVVCNGDIQRVFTDDEKRLIFMEHGAPNLIESKENVEVFRCNGCSQGYWWDDRPSSSASRVFSQATKLLRLCLRGGVNLKDEVVNDETKRRDMLGAFDFVDVAKERQSEEYLANDFDELSVISWLREEKMSSAFNLKSAYALGDTTMESLPFTNVTNDFVGCLDYVFFQQSDLDLIRTLNVPTSFKDLNSDGGHKGHLIPSNIWPSDHIAVGARFRLIRIGSIDERSEKSETPDRTHAPRCGCGCVPPILSLFEMAELRKKAKEKKAVEAASMEQTNS